MMSVVKLPSLRRLQNCKSITSLADGYACVHSVISRGWYSVKRYRRHNAISLTRGTLAIDQTDSIYLIYYGKARDQDTHIDETRNVFLLPPGYQSFEIDNFLKRYFRIEFEPSPIIKILVNKSIVIVFYSLQNALIIKVFTTFINNAIDIPRY